MMSMPELPKVPAPPTPAEGQVGNKPGKKSMQPTFLGAQALPGTGQQMGKTLLGQ